MKRRLFNAGAVVSLVLGLVVAALWWRSYSRAEFLVWVSPNGAWAALSCRGIFELSVGDYDRFDDFKPGHFGLRVESAELIGYAHFARTDQYWMGFGFKRNDYFSHTRGAHAEWIVSLPHWAALCILFAWPVGWLIRVLRKRSNSLTCPACGYDLRGTPSAPGSAGASGGSGGSGGTCPECGAATPARDPASPRA
jgi:hypothetical protein